MCTSVGSCCTKCGKCLLYSILVGIFFVASSLYFATFQVPKWLDESNCTPSSTKDCYCPHYDNYDYDSLFVGFDICLSNKENIDIQNYDRYLKYSTSLTRNNISIGSNKMYNISFNINDYKLFDNKYNRKCIKGESCKTKDLFAHIIIYDYPLSYNKQKTYINHYSIKLTKHEFKEIVTEKHGTLYTKLKHSIHLENQMNISYVTEYGCFDRYYWGNRIIFPNIRSPDPKNWADYVPIVMVYHQISYTQHSETSLFPTTNLSISFNPNSIFRFQVQSLLRMDKTTEIESQRNAPEMFLSYRLFSPLSYLMNSELNGVISSYDQLEEFLKFATYDWISMFIAAIIGLISLKQDFKYWTDSKLTMKNICCASILIHFIVPLMYPQNAPYCIFTGAMINVDDADMNMNGNYLNDYYDDLGKRYEEYSKHLDFQQRIGSVIVAISVLFVALLGICVFVLFPVVKAIKCFNLKRKEGVINDNVAVFEVILVIIACMVVAYDYTLIQYFLRYIGMSIFLPQIIVNFCLNEEYSVPKLPIIVWLLQILDETIASLTLYYTNSDIQITTSDALYWFRDVFILTILYTQYKMRDVAKPKIE